MEIFNIFRFKKVLLSIVFILIIASLAIGIWFKRDAMKQRALESELQKVEEQIASTEKRIKELSELSPEEVLQREKEREILSALGATDDAVIAGVEIIKGGGKKVIKNNIQGYQIEIPLNLLVARSISSDHLELHDQAVMCQGDPLCQPVILINIAGVNPDRLELEDWFISEEQKVSDSIYSPREKLVFNGREIYRVTENVPTRFKGYYYYWTKEGRVYSLRVSSVDEQNYRSYIETLDF